MNGEKIENTLNLMGLTESFGRDPITVSFSDEEPKVPYGSHTISEIKEHIRKLWGHIAGIEDILAGINDDKSAQNVLQPLIETILCF